MTGITANVKGGAGGERFERVFFSCDITICCFGGHGTGRME